MNLTCSHISTCSKADSVGRGEKQRCFPSVLLQLLQRIWWVMESLKGMSKRLLPVSSCCVNSRIQHPCFVSHLSTLAVAALLFLLRRTSYIGRNVCFVHLQGASKIKMKYSNSEFYKQVFISLKVTLTHRFLWSRSSYYMKVELLASKPQVYVCDKQLFF